MDKLTDILSSFFVSSPKPKRNEKKKEHPQLDKETEMSRDTRAVTVGVQTKQTESDDPIVSEIFSEIQSIMNKMEADVAHEPKEQTHVAADVAHEPKEQTNVAADVADEPKEQTNVAADETKEETNVAADESKDETKEQTDVAEETDTKDEPTLSSLSSLTETDGDKNNISMKKYILRPCDFYKSNLLIVNDDIKDSIEIVSDLLYKLGLMKDVNVIYDNNIHVITSLENKKEFTKMLLDNPYLYFTNFNVKQKISRQKIRDLDRLEQRTIYIIDSKTLTKPLSQKDIQILMTKNVHVIIIAGEDYNLNQMYNIMGGKRLLIHKLNKSRNMQKHFYKTVIKKLCLTHNLSFDDYYTLINNEDLDVKYIILKQKEIRYN